jgi:hypothetical protein
MNAVPNASEIEAKSISIYGSSNIFMDKTRYSHYNINYHFVWIPRSSAGSHPPLCLSTTKVFACEPDQCFQGSHIEATEKQVSISQVSALDVDKDVLCRHCGQCFG